MKSWWVKVKVVFGILIIGLVGLSGVTKVEATESSSFSINEITIQDNNQGIILEEDTVSLFIGLKNNGVNAKEVKVYLDTNSEYITVEEPYKIDFGEFSQGEVKKNTEALRFKLNKVEYAKTIPIKLNIEAFDKGVETLVLNIETGKKRISPIYDDWNRLSHPVIDENRVIWFEKEEVGKLYKLFFYNIATGEKEVIDLLGKEPKRYTEVMFSGKYIAWESTNENNIRILQLYNIDTKELKTIVEKYFYSPCLYKDKIAWYDGQKSIIIYLLEKQEFKKIYCYMWENAKYFPEGISIFENTIVYSICKATTGTINFINQDIEYTTDLQNRRGVPTTSQNIDRRFPIVYGNKIFWGNVHFWGNYPFNQIWYYEVGSQGFSKELLINNLSKISLIAASDKYLFLYGRPSGNLYCAACLLKLGTDLDIKNGIPIVISYDYETSLAPLKQLWQNKIVWKNAVKSENSDNRFFSIYVAEIKEKQ